MAIHTIPRTRGLSQRASLVLLVGTVLLSGCADTQNGSSWARNESPNYLNVPFDSDRWSRQLWPARAQGISGWTMTPESEDDQPQDDIALLEDVQLKDGIIEFDFIGTTPKSSAVEVVFRAASQRDYEKIYCRLQNSGLQEAVQYMPVIGGTGPWRLYKQEQGRVDFLEGWNHLQLVLQGTGAQLFINDSPEPVLSVDHLRNQAQRGMIGLTALGQGVFVANFRYAELTPSDRVEDSKPTAGQIADNWEVVPLPEVDLERPFEQFTWKQDVGETVATEVDGLLNLIRYRAHCTLTQQFNAAASRLVIQSENTAEQTLRFGFFKRIQIFLNGESLLWDELPSRDEQVSESQGNTDGWVRLTRTNEVTLPLRKGSNELIILSEGEGFGRYDNWGLYAELANIKGLRWDETTPGD